VIVGMCTKSTVEDSGSRIVRGLECWRFKCAGPDGGGGGTWLSLDAYNAISDCCFGHKGGWMSALCPWAVLEERHPPAARSRQLQTLVWTAVCSRPNSWSTT
jgi:hypothetical protein